MAKPERKPYSDRPDLDKIQSNWTKITGLLNRGEWSAAIVRAATATEIAANLVVREELIVARKLDEAFVDHLLKWANGLQGKFDKLILRITNRDDFRRLQSRATAINNERNEVVHRGSFKREATARKIVREASEVISGLVPPYHPTFDLRDVLSGISRAGEAQIPHKGGA